MEKNNNFQYLKQLLEPEIHVVGEIIGGSGFSSNNAFCTYEITSGKQWVCVGGNEQGQSQVDYPLDDNQMYIWNHPIDIHYYTQSIQGWPQIIFTIGKLDSYGNNTLIGYAFCYIPTSNGIHELDISVWRPKGTSKEEVFEYFLGGVPHIVDKDLINDPFKAREDRCRITTVHQGTIHIRLEVMLRNMKSNHSIQTS